MSAVGALAIPADLRERDQWVVWRFERRDGGRTKVPYNPVDGEHARANDPATWASYEMAVGMAAQNGVAGIGFVFSRDDPFCGVDLDDCVSDGELQAEAAAIVDRLGTYCERSVSGTGAHAIGRADLNGFERNRTSRTPWGGEFEVYDRGRFFVMTGDHLAGTPDAPVDFQAALDPVLAELFPPTANGKPTTEPRASTRTDAEVLERAFGASNGQSVQALYRGDAAGYPSRSEADLGLCSMLAFWTGGDRDQLDRLFRGSGLMRPKWERADYRDATVAKALEGAEFFDWEKVHSPPKHLTGGEGGGGASGGDPEVGEAAEAIRRAILDDGQEVGRSGEELREAIPGTNGLLKRAAAHQIFGARESGKTWVMLLLALAAANAGERVLYLDLENGEPEMRERVEAILDASDWSNPLDTGALRIVSYPTLSRTWRPEDWAEAMSGWTVVVLDPLREVLVAHGLEEKDGFGVLVGARIGPLRARGITVVVGANVGHENKDRPRGDSRQEDALPQVYRCVGVEEFNQVIVGRVRLICKRSRYGDTGREWEARVGGDVFELPATLTESPQEQKARAMAEKETNFRRAVVTVLREESPLSRNQLLKRTRETGLRVRTAKADEWLAAMLSDPAGGLVHSDAGYASGVVPEGGSHPGSGGGSRRYVEVDVAAAESPTVEDASICLQASHREPGPGVAAAPAEEAELDRAREKWSDS